MKTWKKTNFLGHLLGKAQLYEGCVWHKGHEGFIHINGVYFGSVSQDHPHP